MTHEKLIDSAIRYASIGWYVLPIHSPTESGGCTCRLSECVAIGKHPRTMKGIKDATTNVDVIRGWWEKWPIANIGIATGETGFGKHLVVVDVDTRGDGLKNWDALAREHDRVPDTAEAITGSGGRHVFFLSDTPVKSSVDLIAAGIDMRSAMAFIVRPPSIHKSGKCYEWIKNPFENPVAHAPQWLLDMASKKPAAQIPKHDVSGTDEFGSYHSWK